MEELHIYTLSNQKLILSLNRHEQTPNIFSI